MRQLFTFAVLFFIVSAQAQNFDFSKISPGLETKLSEQPDQEIAFYILLQDQVDVLSMKRSFEDRQVTLDQRSFELITALKAKASATQGPLLAFLRNSEAINQESIQPYWVTNTIFAKGKGDAIAQLSRRSDVQLLEPELERYLSDHVYEACDTPPIPNGRENGHTAIKANKLWEMGYTGYGQIAMILDTGMDRDHPSLVNNYRGLYFPEQGYTGTGAEPTDCNGHGSHVTGTVVGINRDTRDTIGVAFNAQWIAGPIDLLGGCSDIGLSDIGNFQFALNPDGDETTSSDMPAAINNSWGGGPGCSNMTTLSNTLTNLETAGIAVVWAAGNAGPSASSISSQADITLDLVNTFSVGNLNGNNPNFPINGGSSRGPSLCGGTGSLSIKPEVSAPGSGVRSCNGNGGFQTIGGTSMASPHVTGAVVLLKEAFPYLTGEDIKLALYFSCIDLGAVGEDNTYGMGIIDIEAAFNYLVDQGNEPVDPNVSNDVIAIQMDSEERYCGGSFTATVEFENAGTNDLTALDILYELKVGEEVMHSGTYDWTGNLGQNERDVFEVPTTIVPDGLYDLVVTFINPNSLADEHPMNNKLGTQILVSGAEPIAPVLIGDVDPCGGSNALLQLDLEEAFDIKWYLTEFSSSVIGTGPNFLTPPLSAPYIFYLNAKLEKHGGIIDREEANSDLNSTDGGLVFDVFTDIKLKSVKVYADVAGPRLISIRNAGGVQIGLKTLFLSEPGEHIVDLDFEIPPGFNYRLVLTTGPTLYSSTDATFPYDFGGAMSIKATTSVNDPAGRYRFFYDWVIEHEFICGRQPVLVDYQGGTDSPVADFGFTLSENGEASFNNLSTGGTSYFWDFGDGTTSTEENPDHTYSENGNYTVSLVTTGANECADAELMEVIVDVFVSISELEATNQIKVFPNPTQNQLTVQFDFAEAQKVQLNVVDVLGRTLERQNAKVYQNDHVDLNLSNYSEGIYYLVFELDDVKVVKKVVKMK